MISIKCGPQPFSRTTSSIVQKVIERRCISPCGMPVKYADPAPRPGDENPRQAPILGVRVKDGVTQVRFANGNWEDVKVGGIIQW